VRLDHLAALIDVIEADVGIGEDDLVDGVAFKQRIELLLRIDRNAARVAHAGKRSRIATVFDMRYLCCRKSGNLKLRVVPVTAVEDMKVTSGCSHDNQFLTHDSRNPPVLRGHILAERP
jgi:hypothetical protein